MNRSIEKEGKYMAGLKKFVTRFFMYLVLVFTVVVYAADLHQL